MICPESRQDLTAVISETSAAITAGAIGIALLAGGSTLAALPPIDQPAEATIRRLRGRRRSVLTGSLAAITGTALLLWPVAAVAAIESVEGWPSLRLFSIAVATLGSMFMAAASLMTIALAWPDADTLDVRGARLLHQIAHLATWSASAPVGAIFVVATTAAAHQAGIAGPILFAIPAIKVVTVGVEIVGVGRRRGWNAGGWARGTSGYATVLWYATLLLALGHG
jgi:hypothetical protein